MKKAESAKARKRPQKSEKTAPKEWRKIRLER